MAHGCVRAKLTLKALGSVSESGKMLILGFESGGRRLMGALKNGERSLFISLWVFVGNQSCDCDWGSFTAIMPGLR